MFVNDISIDIVVDSYKTYMYVNMFMFMSSKRTLEFQFHDITLYLRNG